MNNNGHAAKPGDKIVIARRPDMPPAFYRGYEIGDIGVVQRYEALCVRVEWLTNKGDHKDADRVRSILPDEYDVLPQDGGIVGAIGKSIDFIVVDDLVDTPNTITGRKAVVLDRVRVTRLDPANDDDTYGIVVGDIGEVVYAGDGYVDVRWLTNLAEYDDTTGPMRSFTLNNGEYEIIPYSEPLPS